MFKGWCGCPVRCPVMFLVNRIIQEADFVLFQRRRKNMHLYANPRVRRKMSARVDECLDPLVETQSVELAEAQPLEGGGGGA